MPVIRCDYCGKDVNKKKWLINKHNFCNLGCYHLWNRGTNHPNHGKRVPKCGTGRVGVSPTNKKHFVNSDFFKVIDSEEKAYWFGFILADGNVQASTKNGYSFNMVCKDKEHLELFKECVKYTGAVSESGGYPRIYISDKKFVNNLINIGVVPRKTKKVEFPNEDILPKNLIQHFIRGYLDGDGSISFQCNNKHHKYYLSLAIVGTHNFIKKLSNILYKECDLKSESFYLHSNNLWCLGRSQNQATKICGYIYNNSTIFLQRKFNNYWGYRNAV
jgi:DNA-binding transcriptional regulator WhiA